MRDWRFLEGLRQLLLNSYCRLQEMLILLKLVLKVLKVIAERIVKDQLLELFTPDISNNVLKLIRGWLHDAEDGLSFQKGLDDDLKALSMPRIGHIVGSYQNARETMSALHSLLEPKELAFLVATDTKVIGSMDYPCSIDLPKSSDPPESCDPPKVVGDEDPSHKPESKKKPIKKSGKVKTLSYSDICAVQACHRSMDFNQWKKTAPIWVEASQYYEALMGGRKLCKKG